MKVEPLQYLEKVIPESENVTKQAHKLLDFVHYLLLQCQKQIVDKDIENLIDYESQLNYMTILCLGEVCNIVKSLSTQTGVLLEKIIQKLFYSKTYQIQNILKYFTNESLQNVTQKNKQHIYRNTLNEQMHQGQTIVIKQYDKKSSLKIINQENLPQNLQKYYQNIKKEASEIYQDFQARQYYDLKEIQDPNLLIEVYKLILEGVRTDTDQNKKQVDNWLRRQRKYNMISQSNLFDYLQKMKISNDNQKQKYDKDVQQDLLISKEFIEFDQLTEEFQKILMQNYSVMMKKYWQMFLKSINGKKTDCSSQTIMSHQQLLNKENQLSGQIVNLQSKYDEKCFQIEGLNLKISYDEELIKEQQSSIRDLEEQIKKQKLFQKQQDQTIQNLQKKNLYLSEDYEKNFNQQFRFVQDTSKMFENLKDCQETIETIFEKDQSLLDHVKQQHKKLFQQKDSFSNHFGEVGNYLKFLFTQMNEKFQILKKKTKKLKKRQNSKRSNVSKSIKDSESHSIFTKQEKSQILNDKDSFKQVLSFIKDNKKGTRRKSMNIQVNQKKSYRCKSSAFLQKPFQQQKRNSMISNKSHKTVRSKQKIIQETQYKSRQSFINPDYHIKINGDQPKSQRQSQNAYSQTSNSESQIQSNQKFYKKKTQVKYADQKFFIFNQKKINLTEKDKQNYVQSKGQTRKMSKVAQNINIKKLEKNLKEKIYRSDVKEENNQELKKGKVSNQIKITKQKQNQKSNHKQNKKNYQQTTISNQKNIKEQQRNVRNNRIKQDLYKSDYQTGQSKYLYKKNYDFLQQKLFENETQFKKLNEFAQKILIIQDCMSCLFQQKISTHNIQQQNLIKNDFVIQKKQRLTMSNNKNSNYQQNQYQDLIRQDNKYTFTNRHKQSHKFYDFMKNLHQTPIQKQKGFNMNISHTKSHSVLKEMNLNKTVQHRKTSQQLFPSFSKLQDGNYNKALRNSLNIQKINSEASQQIQQRKTNIFIRQDTLEQKQINIIKNLQKVYNNIKKIHQNSSRFTHNGKIFLKKQILYAKKLFQQYYSLNLKNSQNKHVYMIKQLKKLINNIDKQQEQSMILPVVKFGCQIISKYIFFQSS